MQGHALANIVASELKLGAYADGVASLRKQAVNTLMSTCEFAVKFEFV